MSTSRRDFARLMGIAAVSGVLPSQGYAAQKKPADFYEVPNFGNARLLHMTDCHGQLNPVYFREPSINLGIGAAYGQAPHVVGNKFLDHFDIAPGSMEAYAFTYLDFEQAAQEYGKVGGFAHLKTLVDRLRTSYGLSLIHI